MLAKKILNTEFTPLQPDSEISSALAKMDAWHSSSIPVVEPTTRKVVGHILFEDVAGADDESLPISSLTMRPSLFVFQEQHVFEVARQMLQHEVRVISVVNRDEQYVGVVEKKNVLEAFSTMLNITTSGSVIIIEMMQSDFTLSELVHLIEMEGAKILGLTVEQTPDNEMVLQISIKLSHLDTSAVISSLQRHGYTTTTENRFDLLQTDYSNRADELMRYLDV